MLLIVAILALSACGEGSDPELAATPTTASVSTATPAATPVLGSAKTIVETAIIACREKNGELLGALVAGGASESELETLFGLARDVQLLSMTIPPGDSDAVSVTVGLSIQYEGGTEQAERTWELAEQDGVWRFTSLPDCF